MLKRSTTLLALLCCGCASQLPTEAWPAEPMAVIAGRTAGVKTLSARGEATLTSSDGQTIHLESVLIAELPGKLRLRAWKFDHAAMDLTITGDQVWLWAAPQAKDQMPTMLPAKLGDRAAEVMITMLTGLPPSHGWTQISDDGESVTFKRPLENTPGWTWQAVVDRRTVTAREYRLVSPEGRSDYALRLEDYRRIDGVLWSTRLVARQNGGTITVRLSDVEFNQPLPAQAFTPPVDASPLTGGK
jgi:outer membrane lipoprotein-sorting protein